MATTISVHTSEGSQDSGAVAKTEPLYQVKLLNALRSGDPALIHPFLIEIGKDRRSSYVAQNDVGAAALHLAIRCASGETVALLLSHRAISPNGVHPPGSGTTALHLAAMLGRADVVNVLLEQADIDDSLRDSSGRTCREVAKGRDVVKVIDDSRAFLNACYRSLLRTYVHSAGDAPPPGALLDLLRSPRARFAQLAYLDDDAGTALLHEAARRKDLRLIELAVRAGADVFVRDRAGKMAYDRAGKDDRVKVFLKQFANNDTTLIDDAPLSEPPVLKGYLNKYTNVARGYSTRWFVLKDGVLSYFRHQEDENVACRGSISVKTAVLKAAPNADKLRFEVCSVPVRGSRSTAQKWYLKATHPVEAHRWTQGIRRSLEWHKRQTDAPASGRKSHDSDAVAASGDAHRDVGPSIFPDTSYPSSLLENDGDGETSSGIGHRRAAVPSSGCEEDVEKNDASSASGSLLRRAMPHESVFELHGNSTAAQMEMTAQLLSDLTLPPNTPQRTREVQAAVRDSFSSVQTMLGEYVQMVKDREQWLKRKLEREAQRLKAWEESLQVVVREGDALEKELRRQSRRRGSRVLHSGVSEEVGTLRGKPSAFVTPPPPIPETPVVASVAAAAAAAAAPASDAPLSPAAENQLAEVVTPTAERDVQEPHDSISPLVASIRGDSVVDTDEEDEFFDAIESNTLPNLVVPEPLASPAPEEPGSALHFDPAPFAGYQNLRQHLLISSDNRPATSLWAVLKSSIGKDLTKISFPVSFNEPTSMLQRMAEDMEFSECLDVASHEEDPHRRIIFVAAFAMSNYSSTIGRIAKPFNPMLGETFEYVRLNKDYRYVSEQVSHHPPISACWAESPTWSYYGEVFARNKFMGKSFEIEPTGVAHTDLLIPEKLGPNYPKAKGKRGNGKVVEHYSWKKVVSSVSGFILGSPTIDHYGDMIITNHRTQDQCILTFKPRGWRGKDAFEISGYVQDASGTVTYDIAGRWNSQLIARAAGTGSGFLHPDARDLSPDSSTTPEYILLWRNSEKPTTPFNLSPFAITLNDCPRDTLRPYLCPTDCRLRPDQRAFELGKYALANELKSRQEELQRATRAAREQGKLPEHQPRWFFAETDGDTGERVWSPSRVENEDELEYWDERMRVFREGGPWTGVEPIFVEEPPSLHEI